MLSWFRRPDRLDDRAFSLGSVLARRFGADWEAVTETTPSIAACNREEWQQVATVAAALLAVFPLLKASGGDSTRFSRARSRLLAGVRATHPSCGALIREAESATIPPSGYERTRTLREVDETTALALAGWVVRHLGGSDAVGQSWEDIRRVSERLREAVHGYWDAAES